MWSAVRPESSVSAARGRRKSSAVRKTGPSKETKGLTNPRERCCFGGQSFFDALKAMITRFLFLIHASIAVWRVSYVAGTDYWWLSLAFVGLLVETIIVLAVKKGHEWKW